MAQPLGRFGAGERHTLLAAYLSDLSASLTDQTLDMLDKILDELVRKGNKKQERDFLSNVRALNVNLAVLAIAGDAKEHWAQLKESGQTRLAPGGTVTEYLDGRRQRLGELLAEPARDVDSVENVTVDKDGVVHLAALDTRAASSGSAIGNLITRAVMAFARPFA